jgi:hypothetical protein
MGGARNYTEHIRLIHDWYTALLRGVFIFCGGCVRMLFVDDIGLVRRF